MRQSHQVRALRFWGGIGLMFGALAAVTCVFALWVMNHNAYLSCAAMPSPPGAYEFEGGPAGGSAVAFPVAGLECVWNAVSGGTFRTFHPEPALAIGVWLATFTLLAGGLLIATSAVLRDRGTRSP